MTSKEAFLAQIAKQLGRDRQSVPPKREIRGAPDFWRAYHIEDEIARTTRFSQEVEALGGKVSVYSSKEDLHEGCQRLLESLDPKSILTWDQDVLAHWGISPLLDRWPFLSLQDPNKAIHADVGITAVSYAIADTGTLVLYANEHQMRATSLFPAVHIALVAASQIKTRMGEVFSQLDETEKIPSSIHFISGPSRSSDIENDLSIGVHGPAALHVMVLQD